MIVEARAPWHVPAAALRDIDPHPPCSTERRPGFGRQNVRADGFGALFEGLPRAGPIEKRAGVAGSVGRQTLDLEYLAVIPDPGDRPRDDGDATEAAVDDGANREFMAARRLVVAVMSQDEFVRTCERNRDSF
jgi:hypothetical protein